MKIRSFREIDRLCMICVDEMSIKANLFYNASKDIVTGLEDIGGERSFKPALTATVVMVKDLTINWKQPLAYYFVNSTCSATTLKDLLFDIIKKLNEIGLKVCALVSDMGSNNIQMTQMLHISPENAYFFVDEQKIVFMFDTPQFG